MAKLVKQSAELFPMPLTAEGRLEHIERCGRVCYKSEGKTKSGSASAFVASLIKRQHESVLEHAWITLEVEREEANDTLRAIAEALKAGYQNFIRFTPSRVGAVVSGNARAWRFLMTRMLDMFGILPHSYQAFVRDNPDLFAELDIPVAYDETLPSVEIDPAGLRYKERLVHEAFTIKFICDRGISHEIVRHRVASYSQESTRYCNYSKDQFGGEISVIEPWGCEDWPSDVYTAWTSAVCDAEKAYIDMLKAGIPPQNARDVLPTCLKTELVMTATCDEWIHFLTLRGSEAAHPKIRELATQVRDLLDKADPQIFHPIIV